jgi:hypothetical protein
MHYVYLLDAMQPVQWEWDCMGVMQEQAPCFCRQSWDGMSCSIRRSSSSSVLRCSSRSNIYFLASVAVASAACRLARLCALCSSLCRGIRC